MLLTLEICTLLILLATLLPLSRNSHWLVRGLDFPRLQLSVLAGVLLLAHAFFLDTDLPITWALIITTAGCLAWQLWWIAPYTPLWPTEVKASLDDGADRQLSLLVANVLKPNRNADELIALVNTHQPDVLVTLESDQWWEDKLRTIETEMPYSVKCPLDNLYGMHLYSRLPLSEQEVCYLVEKDVPSIHAALQLRTGDKIRAHFLHPAPPSPTENSESAQRDAELVVVAQSVAKSDQPVIVAGDLNDVSWSATTRLFRKISGLLDPRVGRGVFSTFHVNYPLVRWPLDQIFHSTHFTLQDIQRLPSIGSDHFPMLVRLTFTPVQGANQQGIETEPSDLERAKAISDQQEVTKVDVPRPAAC